MIKFKLLAVGTLVLAVGCATRVSVMSTHRESVSSQAKVLAIAARNLEDSISRNRAGAEQEDAARAVQVFHAEAEEFARAAGRWLSEDNVNDRYEKLIEAWVKVKHTFADLKPDRLTQDAYGRAQREWDKLARTTGYAGRTYEQQIEKNYQTTAPAAAKP